MRLTILCAAALAVMASAPTTLAKPSVTPAPEWAKFGEPGQNPDKTVTIIATEMKFSPNDLTVTSGEMVRFVVVNEGIYQHEFVVGDQAFQAQHQKEMMQMPDMKMSEANELDLPPGQTKSLTWRFTRPGELLFACDLPGHAKAGMLGHIHVRAASTRPRTS